MPDTALFFGQDQAVELAITRWGSLARTWNRAGGRCEIGVGGVGMPHIVIGSGGNWVDAAREAGLLESEEECARIYRLRVDAFVGRFNG